MNNQKILLIDYDPASISRTATPLTKAGYEVEVAKDGLSGLAAFERSRPALVLVEAMLPRKHGFEVCQEIKARPEGKSTPVLITTAVCRGRKYRMDALQIYGCDEYIEKPIPDNELVTMIGRFIDQADQARAEVHDDLSEAIDEAKTDKREAIEKMSDDELEAKIDSLLMGDEDPDEAPVLEAPPVPKDEPAPVPQRAVSEPAAVAVAPAADTAVEIAESDPAEVDSPEENDAFDADTEMERRVAAMAGSAPVASEPSLQAAIPPAAKDPLMDSIESETRIDKPAAPLPAARPEPAPASEAPTAAAKGGSRVAIYAIAAVVVLGIAGFLAFRGGLFGGGNESPEPAEVNVAGVMQAPAPAVESTPDREPIRLNSPAEPALPAESSSNPQGRPEQATAEPVETKTEPEVAPTPRPVVPPKPKYRGPSRAEIAAARLAEEQAAEALQAVAGSMQTQLLSDPSAEPTQSTVDSIAAVELEDDIPLGAPVRPRAQRGELFDINDVDRAPVPVKFDQPVYDELARRKRQEGVILIDVLVDETGQIAETRLAQEIPNSRLNDAAVRAARRWSYQPAIKDGVPVMVWKRERIIFQLE